MDLVDITGAVMLYSFLRENFHCQGRFSLPNGKVCICFPTFDEVKKGYRELYVRSCEEDSTWEILSESNYPDLLDEVGGFEIWGVP